MGPEALGEGAKAGACGEDSGEGEVVGSGSSEVGEHCSEKREGGAGMTELGMAVYEGGPGYHISVRHLVEQVAG